MSAVNGKGGLIPIGTLGGNPWNHKVRSIPIASGYATSIFRGDIVSLSSGTATRAAVNFSAGAAVGVLVGVSYTDPNLKQLLFRGYWPASTVASDAVAYVCDDPDAVFLVQSDAALTAAALGKNSDLVQTAAGSTTTENSGMNFDGSEIATTNTLSFRVVGLFTSPDNAWTDSFPKILVMFNHGEHFYRQATGL
jgi:hypothetical protein